MTLSTHVDILIMQYKYYAVRVPCSSVDLCLSSFMITTYDFVCSISELEFSRIHELQNLQWLLRGLKQWCFL